MGDVIKIGKNGGKKSDILDIKEYSEFVGIGICNGNIMLVSKGIVDRDHLMEMIGDLLLAASAGHFYYEGE
jgi:phosphoribosylformylglycinamidine (FGAM) synthase-like amidotransferase family enzyme